MEAVFKTKLNAAVRKKEIMKLGLPDCNWTKSPELDAFVVSRISKDIDKNDNTEQKFKSVAQATAPLAAVVECSDSEDFSSEEVIQGIRTALLSTI